MSAIDAVDGSPPPSQPVRVGRMEERHGVCSDYRLDLGKSVFQVHGVSVGGAVVVQRGLTRGRLLAFFAKQPACLVGMEACAASLGARASEAWAQGSPDAAPVREAL